MLEWKKHKYHINSAYYKLTPRIRSERLSQLPGPVSGRHPFSYFMHSHLSKILSWHQYILMTRSIRVSLTRERWPVFIYCDLVKLFSVRSERVCIIFTDFKWQWFKWNFKLEKKLSKKLHAVVILWVSIRKHWGIDRGERSGAQKAVPRGLCFTIIVATPRWTNINNSKTYTVRTLTMVSYECSLPKPLSLFM